MNQNNENQNQPIQPTQATPGTPTGTPQATAPQQPAPQQAAPNAPTTQFQGLGQIAQGVAPDPSVPSASGSPDTNATWQQKYEKEHKKSRILAATTAAACVLALGAGIWGATKSSGPERPDFASGQFPGGQNGQGGMGGPGGGFGGPGGQGGPGQMFSNMFNSDGSINTEALNEFKSRMPQGIDVSQIIDRAVSSGAITEEQGKKLKEALESSSGTTSGSNSDYESNSTADSTGQETA